MLKLSILLTILTTMLIQNLSAQKVILTNEKKYSNISYLLIHPAHKVYATSKELEAKIEFDKATNQVTNVIARVKVISFDSQNSNRDSHAMELIEAIKYPFSSFQSNKIVYKQDSVFISGNLTFHGITKFTQIRAKQWLENQKLKFKGNFEISLEAFGVERPKLLFVPTEDILNFDFYIEFVVK